MRYLVALLLFTSSATYSQENMIVSLDLVKFKAGNEVEAMYFFENNWKIFRDSALAKGFIVGYEMMQSISDTSGADVFLVTTYANKQSFERSEDNFAPIMKKLRPNGPALLNYKKREDLFDLVESYTTSVKYGVRSSE